MTGERVAARMAGKHLLLTGATGFIGESLLERILHDLPDTTVSVIVRGKGWLTADQRVENLLQSPGFGRLSERLTPDGIKALVGTRIHVLEGDLDNVPDLPGDLDIVIHCAGEVSFDPAIDEGFATNLGGTLKLLEAVRRSGSTPHYVHISTAFVAGRQQGRVREGRLDHDVDWEAEAEAATRVRARVDTDSRTAERLSGFLKEAEREHSHSGHVAIGADAERRRREWAATAMVDAGRERARTLGWTDCYTFTKAMAERAVEDTAGDLPVTIVRPSIVESALRQPYPGWIVGFKMAEPVILAYGRGDLIEFPGMPDATFDVIPVDYVVNATLVAAATPPEPGDPAYITICSGARNPVTYQMLYDYVRGYFLQHPLVQRDRGAVQPPTWQWPGLARVEQLLNLGNRAHLVADRVVTALPRSDRTRSWAQSLDRQKRRLDFLGRYFDIYRPYVEADLQFTDAATLALHESLHPDDVEAFGFDAAVIDWRHYIGEVHTPAVVEPLRQLTASRPPRKDPTRAIDLDAERRTDVVAVFDMDGTLLPSNVVESYLWLRLPELAPGAKAREVAQVARALPSWLLTQQKDRGAFLRQVYRRYDGALLSELERIVDTAVTETVLGRLSPAAVRAVRDHRAAGHRVILVTGAVTPLTRPVAALFDEIVSAELDVDAAGRCTGHLAAPPLVGESRAAWLRHRAQVEGWDLAASYAYADSASDLPLLLAVGHPVAVDPDVTLMRIARKERWPVEAWHGEAPVGRSLSAAR